MLKEIRFLEWQQGNSLIWNCSKKMSRIYILKTIRPNSSHFGTPCTTTYIFWSLKYTMLKEYQSRVVYKFICLVCQASYIGKTDCCPLHVKACFPLQYLFREATFLLCKLNTFTISSSRDLLKQLKKNILIQERIIVENGLKIMPTTKTPEYMYTTMFLHANNS